MSRADLLDLSALENVPDRFAWFADDQPDKPFLVLPRELIEPMREIYGDAVDYVEQSK